MGRLSAVQVDASNGVVRAEAGVTTRALAAALADAGMAVAGLVSDPGSDHVGALIARGGVPRRSLTGIEAALPGGDLVQLGGAVLRLIPAAAAVEVAEPAGARDVGELTGVFDPQGILVGG
jgi:FAD/FMN-containing dehydrogenase